MPQQQQCSCVEKTRAVVWPDARRVSGETRQYGIGCIGMRLFFLAFVDRTDAEDHQSRQRPKKPGLRYSKEIAGL